MRPSSVMKAYEQIRDKIIRQEILPGSAITELQLVEELGMSRTPIRKAIDMLIDEGLIGRVPNKHTYAKATVLDKVIMAHELSEALDGMAAYLVAEQIAKGSLIRDDLDVLYQLANDLVRHLENKNIKHWAELDKLFHVSLVMLSGNEFIVQANQENYKHINELLWFKVVHDVDMKESNRMHMAILTAIAAGNAEESRRLAQLHRRRIIQEVAKGNGN